MINKRGKTTIVFLEIAILLVATLSFAYFIGEEFRVVSALDEICGPGYVMMDGICIEEGKFQSSFKPSPSSTGVGVGAGAGGVAVAKETAEKSGSSMASKFLHLETGGFPDAVVSGFQWALAVYGTIKLLGSILPFEEQTTNALAVGASAGVWAGRSLNILLKEGGALHNSALSKFFTFGKLQPATASFVWGAGIAIAIFLIMNKKTETQIVKFECEPWQAPTGGNDCEKCNEQGILPCSEYQCRSLGQACELANPGTDEAKCVWVNRNDVTVPIIDPWDDALLDNYEYIPDGAVSPPDRGVIIKNKDSTTGCVPAFTPLSFGIITDEPAQCKIDYVNKPKYADMQFYFGGSNFYKYNHTQVLSLPSPGALASENLTLQNDGTFQMYVRCEDKNGNNNPANFVFKFCVEEGPDTTPPLIVTTSLINNMPIAHNQTDVGIDVYVNEPSSCKWSPLDQNYDNMENTMQCSSSVFEMNAQMLYKCSTTLTGIKNRQDNKFYFRCKDQPLKPESDRNVNRESYEFVVKGSQPLVITKVEPNETIKDSTETIKATLKAETSAGFEEGKANCYYSETGDNDDYIKFFKTDSNKHEQDLFLPEGEYEYFIKCIDLGGNADLETVSFTIETDVNPPIVTRVYHEETKLKVTTNEKGSCVYSQDSCTFLFDDGIKMVSLDEKMHYTEWRTDTDYYIKCRDEFGNQPNPNQCNIVVRPSEDFTQ